jgi:hypothetical protein
MQLVISAPDLNQSYLLIVSDKKIFRQTFYCGNAPVRTSDCCAVLTFRQGRRKRKGRGEAGSTLTDFGRNRSLTCSFNKPFAPPYFQISHRPCRRSRCVKLGPPDSQRRLQRQQSESWLLHSIWTILYWSYKLLYLNYSAKYHEWLNVSMQCICLRRWYFWLETMLLW